MPLILHLIPYHGIGGVERAAASMIGTSFDSFDFHVATVFPDSAAQNRWVVWNPWHFFITTLKLCRTPPEVLIVSLWRAYAVGILVKLCRPNVRLVAFLHLPENAHSPDRFLTQLVSYKACRVWADSSETLVRRVPGLAPGKGCVISFLTEHISPFPAVSSQATFIFWGRIHVQKRLDRALRIFSAIHARFSATEFCIIGPDGGDLVRIRSLTSELGLNDVVHFMGPKEFFEIKNLASNATFYLQTSEMEGMAMSVVEAMQMGLVPIVTHVGEVANYAEHKRNAIVVSNETDVVSDVLKLLENESEFLAIRERAIATWADKPLYRDSVLAACRDVLS